MPRFRLASGACSALALVALLRRALAQAPAASPVLVIFETELGDITMAVDVEHAPVTAKNFLRYVDEKFYDGGVVNRAVRPDNTVRHDVEIQVIQFQIDPARRREQYPPIPMERTSVTGLKHVDGALSMARSGPDTATASFSIAIGDQPEMDFGGKRNADGQGFAVFGRVVAGMDVVKKIQRRAHRHGGRISDRDARAAHQDHAGVQETLMAVVAVIGASADPTKFGNKALRAFRSPWRHRHSHQPEREDRGGGAGLRQRAGLSGPDRRGHGLRAAAHRDSA